jgi:hypothetical protein
MKHATTGKSPRYFHPVPGARVPNAPYAALRALRPIVDSQTKQGTAMQALQITYATMNAAPPYSPTIYGKRHILPSPIADPAMAMMKVKELPKCSLFAADIC